MQAGSKHAGRLLLMMFCAFLICFIRNSACGELQIEMEADEWTWEPGETAFFHGSFVPDASCSGVSLALSADTRLGDAGELQFLSVNGKNLKIRNRAPNITADLTAGEETDFTAAWILPTESEGRLSWAEIHLVISDADGNRIGEGRMTAGTPEENTAILTSSPVQSADRLMLLLAVLCAVVWGAAVGRNIILRKR